MLQQPQGAARLLSAPQSARGVVRLARTLGQTVLRATREHELDGTPQVDPIAHRNVDRGDSVPRPENLADDLSTMHEIRGATLLPPRLLVASHEPTLGAPYCRDVDKDSQMRGQTHPARMREALGVQNEGVHGGLHLLERTHDGRQLPERKEPWHVREAERCLEAPYFYEGERRELEHHDRGIGPVSSRGHVRATHIPHAIEVERR